MISDPQLPRSESTDGNFPIAGTESESARDIDTKTIMETESGSGDVEPVSPVPFGGTVGKYVIRSKLGTGGMGSVYLAYDSLIEREVAIKILSDDVAASSVSLQRFLQEARSIGRLNHPNVVSIYDIDICNGQYYIVMELISGGSLADLVEKRGPLPWQEACQLIGQAASGLAAAHAAGMVHRDIKPENLMVTKAGIVKVVDFGLSKLVDGANDTRTAVTKQGQILGTPQYMSPEQFESTEVDSRTDIYSLGASLFRLLTGRFPFQDCSTIVQTMMAHLNKPTPKTTQYVPQIPAECDAIIARAMSKRPRDRYQNATELAETLYSLSRHGGKAQAEPIAKPAPAKSPTRANNTSVTIIEEVRPLRTVAIVEPSKMLAAMLRDACIRAGASRVDLLASKQQVFELMRRQVPDLLITAMQLPDCEGIELISELSQQWSLNRTCLVLNSSDTTVEDLIGAGTAASLILAPKKVRPDEILRVVHAAGPCELGQGPFARKLDPLNMRLVVMTDFPRAPEPLAELIRATELLDVSFIGLNDYGKIPVDDVPTVILHLSELSKATALEPFRQEAAQRLPDPRVLLATIDADVNKLYLRTIIRQGVTASVHRLLNENRLKCLLQACWTS